MAAPPERLTWAVDLLDVRPDDEIVEIGCGPGVAAGLVCERLDRGHLTAVDRSASALARAAARNGDHVAAGRVTFVRAELAAVGDLARPADAVFAVDVNVFWTAPDGPEATAVRRLLRPGGVVRLVYGLPPVPGRADRTRRVADTVAEALGRAGFRTTAVRSPSGLLCVTGRLPER